MIAKYHKRSFAFAVPGLILQIACALVAALSASTPAPVKFILSMASLAGYALFTIGTCYYAVAKGYHPLWGAIAGVLSCFGLFMVAILPDRGGVVPDSMTPLPKIDVHARKLGSDADPIRQLLFACQSMAELLKYAKLDGSPGPFQTISEAAKLAGEGRKEEARTRLYGILGLPDLETRQILWIWSALRELGEQPERESAGEILGAVIEVPVQRAYNTLAAYRDGSARYLNYSGAAIVWDAPDPTIKALCQGFLDSTIRVSAGALPRTSVLLPKSGGQVTLLTRSGMHAVSDPPESVVKAAATLMMELINRAKDGNA